MSIFAIDYKSLLPLLSDYFHACNGNRRKTNGKVGLIKITIRKTRGLNSDNKANDNKRNVRPTAKGIRSEYN